MTTCTTQVAPDLPEPETTIFTTNDDNDEVTLRSTISECDSIENSLTNPPDGPDFADLLECRLNQGYDEAYIQNECTFSESYTYESCVDHQDLIQDYSTIVLRNQQEVADSTSDCTTPCTNPHTALGCRKVIWSVVYLNDTDCPNAPDEYEVRITADVYCCD